MYMPYAKKNKTHISHVGQIIYSDVPVLKTIPVFFLAFKTR